MSALCINPVPNNCAELVLVYQVLQINPLCRDPCEYKK